MGTRIDLGTLLFSSLIVGGGSGCNPDACTLHGATAPLRCENGGCYDIANDPSHCGGCDHRCADGYACQGGVCRERIEVRATPKNKVDILFMVDNSAGMAAMTSEFGNRIGQLLAAFQSLAGTGTYADLHLGVVTSDYGAGRGAPGCDPSPGGQRGELQRLGQFADTSCMPPVGENFLHYDFDPSRPTDNNIPAGQNVVNTFKCMAAVGAQGCGFEHQLESVHAALHNNIPENQGFIRPDALLTVVFLTNEDDASAPPVTDVFDRNLVPQYGYEDSYSRQTRFAVQCGGKFPPYGDSGGVLSDCVAASNPGGSETSAGQGPGKQYDISRYIDFFTQPRSMGGVKDDPNDVILVGIDAPASPFSVILSNPGTPTGQAYLQCAPLDETSSPPCVPVLQHSCINPQSPTFVGDPAVRLNTVISAVKRHLITSICDSDYTAGLQDTAQLIKANMGGSCITGKLPDPSNADCIVDDTTTNGDGTTTVRAIPSCAASQGATPCWKVVSEDVCIGVSPDGVGVTVDRGGQPVPAATTTEALCATEPV